MAKENKEQEFRDEQLKKAADQNLKAPNAVPEQRPIASQVSSLPDSDVTQALREEGADEPMPKEAYDTADSEKQLKKADKDSLLPTTRAGQRIKITDGPYEGSFAAVLSVNYDGFEEQQKATSGVASVANYAKVASVMARTRGGRHALVELKPDEYEHVEERHYERGVA